jgi:hypothetical protein
MAQAAPLAGRHCPMAAVPVPPEPRPASSGCSVQGRPSIEATSVSSSAGKHLQLRSAYRAQRQAPPFPLRFSPNVSVRVAFVRNIRHE